MRITGIIAEFNPFHNGHKYLLEEARKQTQCDYLIVIMSGNFTQRGLPAITDKYTRTKMALSSGADLVIELPIAFATSSAQYFSEAGIKLLENTNIVTNLCFGSELGNIDLLNHFASLLLEEPRELSLSIQNFLKQGISFPIARTTALSHYVKQSMHSTFEVDELMNIMRSPNNILGIEYLQALKKYKSAISPITIQRKMASYHEQEIHHSIASATAIRNCLIAGDLSKVASAMPKTCLNLLLDTTNTISYINDFSLLLQHQLLSTNLSTLESLWDLPSNLCRSILNKYPSHYDYIDLVDALTSKTYTKSTVQRSLLRVLLDIKKEHILPLQQEEILPYIRVLGCKQSSLRLLSLLNQKASCPVLTNLGKAYPTLDARAKTLIDYDLYATKLYYCLNKKPASYTQDFSHSFLIYP